MIGFSGLAIRRQPGDEYTIAPQYTTPDLGSSLGPTFREFHDVVEYLAISETLPLRWLHNSQCFRATVPERLASQMEYDHEQPEPCIGLLLKLCGIDQKMRSAETILSSKITFLFPGGARYERTTRYSIKLSIDKPERHPRIEPSSLRAHSWIPSYTNTPLSKHGTKAADPTVAPARCTDEHIQAAGASKRSSHIQCKLGCDNTRILPLTPSPPCADNLATNPSAKRWRCGELIDAIIWTSEGIDINKTDKKESCTSKYPSVGTHVQSMHSGKAPASATFVATPLEGRKTSVGGFHVAGGNRSSIPHEVDLGCHRMMSSSKGRTVSGHVMSIAPNGAITPLSFVGSERSASYSNICSSQVAIQDNYAELLMRSQSKATRQTLRLGVDSSEDYEEVFLSDIQDDWRTEAEDVSADGERSWHETAVG